MVTAGGVTEQLARVGPASIPELGVTSPVDVALAVWPFPLEPTSLSALSGLGYEPITGFEREPEQQFYSSAKDVRLRVVAAGSDLYTQWLLVRDFLRNSAEARAAFLEQPDVTPNFLDEAEQWWTGFYSFSPVAAIANEFDGFAQAWFFGSGWALDLFLGRVTRVHHDIDVALPRTAVQALRRHLNARGWQFVLPLAGRLEPWPPGSPLAPDIQIHAHREGAVIDLLLTQIDAQTWTYRREPSITCPARRAFLRTDSGLPFLAPELVLLFKSKNTSTGKHERPQDERDFRVVLPHLVAEQKAWLRGALKQTDRTHPWLKDL